MDLELQHTPGLQGHKCSLRGQSKGEKPIYASELLPHSSNVQQHTPTKVEANHNIPFMNAVGANSQTSTQAWKLNPHARHTRWHSFLPLLNKVQTLIGTFATTLERRIAELSSESLDETATTETALDFSHTENDLNHLALSLLRALLLLLQPVATFQSRLDENEVVIHDPSLHVPPQPIIQALIEDHEVELLDATLGALVISRRLLYSDLTPLVRGIRKSNANRMKGMLSTKIVFEDLPPLADELQDAKSFALGRLPQLPARLPTQVMLVGYNVPPSQRIPSVSWYLAEYDALYENALDRAVAANNLDIWMVLRRHVPIYIFLRQESYSGITLLHQAVVSSTLEIIAFILAQQSSLREFGNSEDNEREDIPSCTQIHMRDHAGRTALHYAITRGSVSLDLATIRGQHVDPQIRDLIGLTRNSFEMTSTRSRNVDTAVIDLLLRHGARPDVVDKTHMSPLHATVGLLSTHDDVVNEVRQRLQSMHGDAPAPNSTDDQAEFTIQLLSESLTEYRRLVMGVEDKKRKRLARGEFQDEGTETVWGTSPASQVVMLDMKSENGSVTDTYKNIDDKLVAAKQGLLWAEALLSLGRSLAARGSSANQLAQTLLRRQDELIEAQLAPLDVAQSMTEALSSKYSADLLHMESDVGVTPFGMLNLRVHQMTQRDAKLKTLRELQTSLTAVVNQRVSELQMKLKSLEISSSITALQDMGREVMILQTLLELQKTRSDCIERLLELNTTLARPAARLEKVFKKAKAATAKARACNGLGRILYPLAKRIMANSFVIWCGVIYSLGYYLYISRILPTTRLLSWGAQGAASTGDVVLPTQSWFVHIVMHLILLWNVLWWRLAVWGNPGYVDASLQGDEMDTISNCNTLPIPPPQSYADFHSSVTDSASPGILQTFGTLSRLERNQIIRSWMSKPPSPDREVGNNLRRHNSYQELRKRFTLATLTGDVRFRKLCETCCIERPARSKHCSVCNRCVYRFDHHCPMINNCVGGSNYLAFIMWLIGLLLLIPSLFIEFVAYARTAHATDVTGWGVAVWKNERAIAVWIASYVIYLIYAVYMLKGHFPIILRNMTTNECILALNRAKQHLEGLAAGDGEAEIEEVDKSGRGDKYILEYYCPDSHHGTFSLHEAVRYVNPFDRGAAANIRFLLGIGPADAIWQGVWNAFKHSILWQHDLRWPSLEEAYEAEKLKLGAWISATEFEMRTQNDPPEDAHPQDNDLASDSETGMPLLTQRAKRSQFQQSHGSRESQKPSASSKWDQYYQIAVLFASYLISAQGRSDMLVSLAQLTLTCSTLCAKGFNKLTKLLSSKASSNNSHPKLVSQDGFKHPFQPVNSNLVLTADDSMLEFS